jgi:O-antigen/teichoic acid export membrane protein
MRQVASQVPYTSMSRSADTPPSPSVSAVRPGEREQTPPVPEIGDDIALANASSTQLLRNFASGYANLAIGVLLSLLLTPILLHRLGPSDFGLWITITSIGAYLGVLDAGVSTAAVQQVSSALAVRDSNHLARILVNARAFFVLTGAAAIVVSLALVPVIGDILNVPPADLPSARVAIALLGVGTAISFVTNVPNAILFGAGRSDRLVLVAVISNAGVQGAQIVVILFGGGLVSLFCVSVVGLLASLLLSHHFVKRMGIRTDRTLLNRNTFVHLVRDGSRNMVITMGAAISQGLDPVIIAAILPVSRVAPYDIALSATNLAQRVSTTGTDLLLPAYSHAFAVGDSARQFRLYTRAVLHSIALALPIVVALIAFGPGILELWLRSVPPDTYQVMVAMSIVLILRLPGHQSFIYLTAIRRNKLLARLALPAAAANLIVSIAATYRFGPVGPVIGTAVQVVALDLILFPRLSCKAMGVPFARYLRKSILPLWPCLTAAVAIALILRSQLDPSSVLAAPVCAVVVTLVGWLASVPQLVRNSPSVARIVPVWLRKCVERHYIG